MAAAAAVAGRVHPNCNNNWYNKSVRILVSAVLGDGPALPVWRPRINLNIFLFSSPSSIPHGLATEWLLPSSFPQPI